MTLLFRNEADILKENIKYHLERGVDHIIAMNNLSVDESVAIADEFSKSGHLTLLHQSEDNYAQDIWCKQMSQLAITEHKADWIIHNDADEFWWPKEGGIKEILKEVPTLAATAPRHNFAPPQDEKTPWLETMIWREEVSRNIFGRQILPKTCHKALPCIAPKPGNHKVLLDAKVVDTTQIPIDILHFPMRNYSQFERKVVYSGPAYDSNPTLWKKTPILELYKLYRENKLRIYYQELQEQTNLVRDARLRSYIRSLSTCG